MPTSGVEEQLDGRRVLVTGATGFIGSHLVERLVDLGAQVTAVGPDLGWRPIVPGLLRKGAVRFVKLRAFWSPAAVGKVESEFSDVEYVVHLGYVMPRGNGPLESAVDDVRRNVLGTLRFMQQLPESVTKICFASSAMVYGPCPSHSVSETDRTDPITAYGAGKLATETYLRLQAEGTGVSVPIMRYATVYGPMETVPRAIPSFIRLVLAGGAPIIDGRGDDVRDYVHVGDVVEATLLALTKTEGVQVYNVGTGTGHTTCEIAEQVIRLAGKRVKPIHTPVEHEPYELVCDIAHAQSSLGYRAQVPLEEGLMDEIRYFADNPEVWRNL